MASGRCLSSVEDYRTGRRRGTGVQGNQWAHDKGPHANRHEIDMGNPAASLGAGLRLWRLQL